MPGDEFSRPLVAAPIRTRRLTLRPLRIAHATEMARVLSDPALHLFIGGEPLSAEELRARYGRMLAGPDDPAVSWCNWVIELRERGDGGEPGTHPEPVEDGGPPVDDGEPSGEREPDGDGVRAGVEEGAGGGRLVGTVQATVTASKAGLHPGRTAELAWVIGSAWQGRGIATEAARGMAEWLEGRGVRTFVAHVAPGHVASATVARAVGLVRTGVMYDGEDRWERRPDGG
ncbi:GNAT family N-acetyltransferase [Streptomyces sp. NBC_01497]|uniref:GNAT family N-acetyltransferase n=1 Tax=Streptomyces sp. NBC_01497 TaxID=2903885 RepID=UPI002E380B12|nr:GNAT family N-acetyltransferase [Streptomyces sp. NBC_01497]